MMREQLAVLHKMVLDTVRQDPVCRRFMTVPGVGRWSRSHRWISRTDLSIRGKLARTWD